MPTVTIPKEEYERLKGLAEKQELEEHLRRVKKDIDEGNVIRLR